MIIETCPKCGHDLIEVMLASNPPIPKKECWNCGWSWTGEPEEIVRVPFNENIDKSNLIVDDLVDLVNDGLQTNNDNLNNVVIGGFEQSACVNCSNNPKNGGSGICNCTLGLPKIT